MSCGHEDFPCCGCCPADDGPLDCCPCGDNLCQGECDDYRLGCDEDVDDADADALASAGMGTDEDYGCYNDDFFGCDYD